jgi:gamma-glutamyltranspeptidase
MPEEKKSFWARIFGSSGGSAREQRVLEYIVHRINEGAALEDIAEEEYVRRNASRDQIDDILSNPKIVEAAREKMQDAFESGELDPRNRPK